MNKEEDISGVVINLAKNYKKIPETAKTLNTDVATYQLRYDTEVYEYIDKFSTTEAQKQLLIEIYSRWKK